MKDKTMMKDKTIMKDKSSKKNNISTYVVRIIAENININWNLPYLIEKPEKGQGTGFFINKEGYILTCAHVVDGAKNLYIDIPSLSSEKYYCKIIFLSTDYDIALLKTIDYKPIDYVEMGDSDELKVGTEVQAVGYPVSISYSHDNVNNLKYTVGIISGQQNGLIQTDTAINPGNSGGPLFCNGKVIGINSEKLVRQDVDNIGFSIPINYYKVLKESFEKDFNKKNKTIIIKRPELLFEYNNTISELLKEITNNKISEGIIVSKIYNESVLKKSGIQVGDIITNINEYTINNNGYITPFKWLGTHISIRDILNRFRNNDKIEIKYFSIKSMSEKRTNIILKPVDYKVALYYPVFQKIDYFIISGLILMNLSYNHLFLENLDIELFSMKYDKEKLFKKQLIVSFVFPNSTVNILNNIHEYDIITKVNNIKVYDLDGLRRALKKPVIINKKEFIKIECKNGKFMLNTIEKCVEEDINYSVIYKYPLNDFQKKYMKIYDIKAVNNSNNL